MEKNKKHTEKREHIIFEISYPNTCKTKLQISYETLTRRLTTEISQNRRTCITNFENSLGNSNSLETPFMYNFRKKTSKEITLNTQIFEIVSHKN